MNRVKPLKNTLYLACRVQWPPGGGANCRSIIKPFPRSGLSRFCPRSALTGAGTLSRTVDSGQRGQWVRRLDRDDQRRLQAPSHQALDFS